LFNILLSFHARGFVLVVKKNNFHACNFVLVGIKNNTNANHAPTNKNTKYSQLSNTLLLMYFYIFATELYVHFNGHFPDEPGLAGIC